MQRIYKVTDKIPVNVDDIVISVSPLKYQAKSEIQAMILDGKPMDAAVMAIRHSLKDIKGVQNEDGSDYKIKIEDGIVSEDSIDDILNMSQGTKLHLIALELLQGIPKEFTDPQTGKTLEGVSFVESKGKSRKKS